MNYNHFEETYQEVNEGDFVEDLPSQSVFQTYRSSSPPHYAITESDESNDYYTSNNYPNLQYQESGSYINEHEIVQQFPQKSDDSDSKSENKIRKSNVLNKEIYDYHQSPILISSSSSLSKTNILPQHITRTHNSITKIDPSIKKPFLKRGRYASLSNLNFVYFVLSNKSLLTKFK